MDSHTQLHYRVEMARKFKVCHVGEESELD